MEMQRHSGGKLSPEEAERLEICEATIDSGLKTFWEVGVALAEVRDQAAVVRRLCELHRVSG